MKNKKIWIISGSILVVLTAIIVPVVLIFSKPSNNATSNKYWGFESYKWEYKVEGNYHNYYLTLNECFLTAEGVNDIPSSSFDIYVNVYYKEGGRISMDKQNNIYISELEQKDGLYYFKSSNIVFGPWNVESLEKIEKVEASIHYFYDGLYKTLAGSEIKVY